MNNNDISNIRKSFDENGFLVIRNYISQDFVTLITDYFLMIIENGGGVSGDPQAPYSKCFYSNPLAETLLSRGVNPITNILGEEVLPTYSYTRLYGIGDELHLHRDRESCEISVSLCLNYPQDMQPSPLYFSKTKDKNDAKSAILYPGDACIYKGCEMWHWREKFVNHDWYLQTFLHYVRKSGPYSDFIFDKRPRLGLKK